MRVPIMYSEIRKSREAPGCITVDLLGARDHVVVSLPGADEMFGRGACESKQFARSTPATTTHRAGVLG